MSARKDRWEKAADREVDRRKKAAGPLFAPLVERPDPEALQARVEARIAAQAAAINDPVDAARLEAQGAVDRATVAAHVSVEELAELDRRRSWCPKAACYTADFWQGKCREMGLPWAGQAKHEAFWAPVYAAEAAAQAKLDAQAAAAGEQLDLPTGVRLPTGMRVAEYRARIAALTEDEQVVFEEAVSAEDQASIDRILAVKENSRRE